MKLPAVFRHAGLTRSRMPCRPVPVLEALEQRTLLSAAPAVFANPELLSIQRHKVKTEAGVRRASIAIQAPSPPTRQPAGGGGFEGITFSGDAANNDGLHAIPPDPSGAAGPRQVVSVVNTSIEWHTKDGVLQRTQGLASFFSRLSADPRGVFDPRVVYDTHAGRFVVIALEQNGQAQTSRILVAVSNNSDPNNGWTFRAVNAKRTVRGKTIWADFPGLAVDDQAIYITTNMFTFADGRFRGSRLWIIDKATGSARMENPTDGAGLPSWLVAPQPAMMLGDTPQGLATFLVSSGWVDGLGADYLSVVRIDNPLGQTRFSNQFIRVGQVTSSFAMPDAPQAGAGTGIDAGDNRIANAVWRDGVLWATNTVNPYGGPDAGQPTAHWYAIGTGRLRRLRLANQGNVGGEEIAPGTATFFPSVAVNGAGVMAIGFSASAPTMHAGAYVAWRMPTDRNNTVRRPQALADGQDTYVRTFGSGPNRWGDYSSISVDPATDRTFWVFNEYALSRGTPLRGEDGQWGTRWGQVDVGGG